MDTVNEKSSSFLTITFYDKDGVGVSPTSATWKVHDLETGTVLKAAVSLSAGSSVEVELTVPINSLVTSTNQFETHVVTVEATYSGSDHGHNEQYYYQVKNLNFVT